MAARETDDLETRFNDLEARFSGLQAKFAKLQALVIDDFTDIKRRLRDLSAAAVPGDDLQDGWPQ